MVESEKYVLDADSFIRSKREHYAFDVCPGYWEALLRHHRLGKVGSISQVRDELTRGNDQLADWAKSHPPETFFEAADDQAIQGAYANVVQWVADHQTYKPSAKRRFMNGADPWLIAFALARNVKLVTYEVPSPVSVKIPDVAKEFGVQCYPPYVMLRRLEVELRLAD